MISIEKGSQLNLQKKDDNSEESTMSTGNNIYPFFCVCRIIILLQEHSQLI